MSQPTSITAVVFEKILAFLASLFLGADNSDIGAARQAASAILASYDPKTDRELRLAALSIAFGFGALDALSRAADPELGLNQVMRLRGNANALNRAAQQNELRLEKLRKQPAPDPQPAEAMPEEPADALPVSTTIADLLAFTRTKPRSGMGSGIPEPASAPTAAVPLSRQQRRAVERKAEKARQRQQEEARRAARRLTTARNESLVSRAGLAGAACQK